jgi:hypothetical protein
MSRIMQSEIGCIIVASLLVFAPVAAMWSLGYMGVTIGGTEGEPQGGIK